MLRDRRGDQAKSRIWYHRQDIKSNRVKVIILHLVDRLLHSIAGILTFIHLWIIVGCICNHIIFNILLCIQIMHYYKDRLLLAIIRSSKILIAAKRMRRARSKIQSIYSRGGVPQTCLILRSEGAMYAQEGGNGTISGGRAKDVSDNEEGVAAQTSCFNIDLSKTWAIIIYRL